MCVGNGAAWSVDVRRDWFEMETMRMRQTSELVADGLE